MWSLEQSGLRRSIAAGVVAAGLSAVSGCGSDDGLATRYPVRGAVTYQNKPLAKGIINFQSASPDGRGASGNIQDGVYSLTTQSPDDGALPGKYRVSIIAKEVDFSEIEAISKKQGGTLPSRKDIGKAFQKAKRTIPAKYESTATSKLEAEVKEESNTIDFTLTD